MMIRASEIPTMIDRWEDGLLNGADILVLAERLATAWPGDIEVLDQYRKQSAYTLIELHNEFQREERAAYWRVAIAHAERKAADHAAGLGYVKVNL